MCRWENRASARIGKTATTEKAASAVDGRASENGKKRHASGRDRVQAAERDATADRYGRATTSRTFLPRNGSFATAKAASAPTARHNAAVAPATVTLFNMTRPSGCPSKTRR